MCKLKIYDSTMFTAAANLLLKVKINWFLYIYIYIFVRVEY